MVRELSRAKNRGNLRVDPSLEKCAGKLGSCRTLRGRIPPVWVSAIDCLAYRQLACLTDHGVFGDCPVQEASYSLTNKRRLRGAQTDKGAGNHCLTTASIRITIPSMPPRPLCLGELTCHRLISSRRLEGTEAMGYRAERRWQCSVPSMFGATRFVVFGELYAYAAAPRSIQTCRPRQPCQPRQSWSFTTRPDIVRVVLFLSFGQYRRASCPK